MRKVLLPNGGEVLRQLDLAGRRRRDELPDGTWLRYRYDADGNPSSIEHRDGQRVDYEVRADCWTAGTAAATTSLTIDAHGMPVAVEQLVGGLTLRAEYRHGGDGRPPAIRYPGATDWLEVAPDGPDAVALRIGGRIYARAQASGDTTTVTFSNGASTVERLADGRLVEVSAQGSEGIRQTRTVRRDASGTITDVAGLTAAHDAAGRLTALGDDRWTYDPQGRLVTGPGGRVGYDDGPMARCATDTAGRTDYTYDGLGRRASATHTGPDGQLTVTTYAYDLFGQLTGVESEHASLGYSYDGWGRLVARRVGAQSTYSLVGVDGHRLVDVDGDGRITASYLWLGEQCIGRVDGPLGGPLAASFHRDPTGRPLAWGDEDGALQRNSAGDAFGRGADVAWDRPGLAGLFGDPETGLLHAGTRWLDPGVAQFLTPDGWFGEDPATHMPAGLRRALDGVPGGTAAQLSPVDAYAWCRYRPLDLTDPSGHNWLGLIYSTISSLLWGVQATSVSLQMWVVDFIIDIFLLLKTIAMEIFSDGDDYWDRSVYNVGAPTASYRLMVPWALWLNGTLRGSRAFTLGNVIWYSGTQLDQLESVSERDRIVGDVIATFFTATDAAAVDVMRARNPALRLTGTASASPVNTINAVAVTTPAGAALNTLLANNNQIAVRVVGAAADELRRVTVTAGTLTVDRALPDSFAGQAVEIRRVDAGLVRLTAGDVSLARTIAIIRGSSAHIAQPVPDKFFPGSDVQVDEFLPAASPRRIRGTVFTEQLIITFATGDALLPYVAGDVVRILSAGTYLARVVTHTVATPSASLVLDVPLPGGVLTGMEVARLVPGGGTVNNQAVSGARLGVTGLPDLVAREGVAVTAGAAVERRIVTGLVLDCTVAAVTAPFLGAQSRVAVVRPDPAVTANGTATTDTVITTNPGQAAGFTVGQPVEVVAGATVVHRLLTAVDAGANTLTLDNAHGIAAATVVTVTLMSTTAADTFFTAEPIAGAGDHLLVAVPSFSVIAAGATVLLGTGAIAVLREVGTAPLPLADLDSPLPASHAINLTVERLTVDPTSLRSNAGAPLTKIRVTFTAAPAFTVGESVHVADNTGTAQRGEEVIDTVAEVRVNEIVLQNPTNVNLTTAANGVMVQAVAATGPAGAGKLDQSKVMIPSDHDEDPYTRRDALQHHEMRHVWQYALWGPFFLSAPIPWLVHVGFSFTSLANSDNWAVRHVNLGAVDSLFALLVWGRGRSDERKSTLVGATVGGGRKTLTLKVADAVAKFKDGYRIDVEKAGGESEFAVVDAVAAGTATLTLRWALPDGRFADGDEVSVLVSPFEQIRKTVSTWFSLNFENLWHDHIPSTWGRALSAVANRESWFPFLGLYFISWIAGGDQSHIPFEQDAAYHSGDLYTSITTSDPATVYVGQFSRVFAYVDTRSGDRAAGIANPNDSVRTGAVEQLSVSAVGGGAMTNAIAGTQPALTPGEVKFRENWFLPLRDDVGNAMGALFAASAPGTYRLHAPNELAKDVVMAGVASVGALESRTITVKAVKITPDPADRLFETEQRTFRVDGDASAQYALRGVAGAVPLGAVGGLAYTARVLAAGTATANDSLELTATYAADHPVFRGAGQLARDGLLAEQRTNVCQAITMAVDELTVAAPPPLTAGTTADFTTPIDPVSIDVAPPPNPALVTGALRVISLGGRPATLRILAPAAVTADVDIVVTLRFGTDPTADATLHKTIPLTIRITPA